MVEQSKPGGSPSMLIILGFCCNCPAFAGGALRPAGFAVANSARDTPVVPMNRATKTRRLKKADFEADFFFILIVLVLNPDFVSCKSTFLQRDTRFTQECQKLSTLFFKFFDPNAKRH